jgi:DNA-binding GntR family transcriptional regulator
MSNLVPLGSSILADRAYESIKRAILSLELEPGSRLVERRLAERFQVSKSPVRDALQRLAGEGLVVQTPYAGMIVTEFDPAFVDELYAVREVLEVMALQLATPRLTAEDLAEAEGSFRDAEAAIRADDRVALGRASSTFHAVLHRRSENRPLLVMLDGLRDKVRIVTSINWRLRDANMWEAHHRHQAILAAARAGDVDAATELMRDHIRLGRLEYRNAFEAMNTRSEPAEEGG